MEWTRIIQQKNKKISLQYQRVENIVPRVITGSCVLFESRVKQENYIYRQSHSRNDIFTIIKAP